MASHQWKFFRAGGFDQVKLESGELLWTTRSSAFIRGEGGWGGDRGPSGREVGVAREHRVERALEQCERSAESLRQAH